MSDETRRALIARLNDYFRLTGQDGWWFLSVGVSALPEEAKLAIVHEVRCCDDFTQDDDPWGEHDCARLGVQGRQIVWKITYYRRDGADAAADPADRHGTKRVMTVMLAEEY